MALRTDWKNDVFEGNRKYQITQDADGNSEIIDVTEYSQEGDIIGADELNAICAEVNETKKSVSDGKILLAAAITAKKVAAAASDTFAVLAEKIGQIILGSGNASAGDVLSGKTFTNDDGVEYTGTMPNQGAKTAALNCGGSYTIPAGYHNGSGKVTANSLASQTPATATAARILSGYTAYVNGNKVTGTIASLAAQTYTPGRANQSIAAGKYLSGAQTIKGDANLLAANIKKGVTIFGITGTWEGYVAGTTEFYNNGANNGLTASTGASFESGAIYITDAFGSFMLKKSSAFNFAPYTKLNIQFKATYAEKAYVIFYVNGADSDGTINNITELLCRGAIKSNVGTTQTISMDIADVNKTVSAFAIRTQSLTGETSGTVGKWSGQIYKIWVS